ncbi:hypothetical protein [Jiangella anatolica]|uniref:TPM domain-containing protein n=1 Tax=Jiangella anatolica TaxID=2670374 RepID=A0A2W2B4R9_9ACTN|nr:hypothetical protein [Jiangella anatolica]PZF82385.1 hypothetical protein C1I92_16760 [Jiangella anatolica]
MTRRLVGLLITLVAAAGGGALAWWLAAPDVTPDRPPTERARAAAAVLDERHVYVDPASAGTFTDDELARLDAAAAASDPQAFLVVWPDSDQAGYGRASDVLHQIGDLTGRPGLYLQVSPGEEVDSTDVGIEAEYLSGYDVTTDAAALLRLIDENDGREYEVGEDTSSHYWGGTGEMVAAALTIGGVSGIGAGVVVLIGWALVRRRRAA